MNLRNKTLAVTLLTLAFTVTVLHFSSSHIIVGGFERLEKQSIEGDVARVLGALRVMIEGLDTTAHDWSDWDDTCAFVEHASSGFVAANLTTAAFETLNLSAIVFVNSSGQIVYGTGYDRDTEALCPLPRRIAEEICDGSGLFSQCMGGATVQGLLALPEDPLLVAARPILTSEGAGPARGVLLMGRRLGENEIAELENVTRLEIDLAHASDPVLTRELERARADWPGEEYPNLELDEDTIAGYAAVNDIHGKPSIILRVAEGRGIDKLARATTSSMLASLAAVCFVAAAVVVWLIESLVLGRLRRLRRQVAGLGLRGECAERLPVRGGDELESVAHDINGMLDQLDEAHRRSREHDERYRMLFDEMLSGCSLCELIRDADGQARDFRYLDVNQAFVKLTGLTREQVVGRAVTDVIPGIEPFWIDFYAEVIRSGKPAVVTRAVTALGKTLKVVAYRTREDQFVAAFDDVTEQLRAEEQTRKAERERAALLENIPDMAWIKNPQGRFVAVNEAFGRACKKRPGEVVGCVDEDFFPRELAIRYRNDDADVMRSGKQKCIEEPFVDAAGREQWIETIKSPIRDEKGDVVGITGIARDVTARRREELRQRKLAAGLHGVVEAADQLIACREVDDLYRRAVELAREKLSVERCGIYLLRDDTAQATYGTDLAGRTTDERDHVFKIDPRWKEYFSVLDPQKSRWVLKDDAEHWNWEGGRMQKTGRGWVAFTAVARGGKETSALFISDAAITHAPFDPVQQEIVAVYCSLLAEIVAQKNSEARLRDLADGLHGVVAAADELIPCSSMDELYRRAVELARERLAVERCAIFLFEGDMVRGTYGTDLDGRTTDERANCFLMSPEWREHFATIQSDVPRWTMNPDAEHWNWDGHDARLVGRGWVAYTAVARGGHRASALFVRDAAVTRGPFDAVRQEIVTVYCSLLAEIIEHKRVEHSLRESEARYRVLNESLEQRVAERTRVAEEANRAKSQFLANMSHELRTPLNAIIGFSQFLKEQLTGPANARKAKYLDNIETSGRHLLHIINDILDISKIEAGRLGLNLETCSLPGLLQETLGAMQAAAGAKSVALRLDNGTELPPLTADAAKVKQILFNLLGNAVKFTEAGGAITVSARADDGAAVVRSLEGAGRKGQRPAFDILPTQTYVVISVADTGIGIKAEDQARVFAPFEQVDASYARHQEGTGLGLTLARKLTELHRGVIWVESEGIPGKGSTFRVALPVDGPRAGRAHAGILGDYTV